MKGKTITLALMRCSKGFIKNNLHSQNKEASEKPRLLPYAPPNSLQLICQSFILCDSSSCACHPLEPSSKTVVSTEVQWKNLRDSQACDLYSMLLALT